MSGGQKQRVSLARACYAQANLYLLDDPLSAVDAHVGRAIFEQVLCNDTGLLRNSTRILVTNHVHLLQKVDRVLVLHEGEVRYDCTYEHLLAEQNRGVDLKEFGIQFDDEMVENTTNHNGQSPNDGNPQSPQSRLEKTANASEPDDDEKGKLIEKETVEEGKVNWSHYFSYFNSLGWPIFSFSITCLLSQAVLSLLASFYLADWSEEAQSVPSNQTASAQAMHHLLVYSAYGLSTCEFFFIIGIVKRIINHFSHGFRFLSSFVPILFHFRHNERLHLFPSRIVG